LVDASNICASVAGDGDFDTLTIDVPNPCTITWNGSQTGGGAGDWFNANNWTPNNSAPSQSTSVNIPVTPNPPNITGSANCASVNLSGVLATVGFGGTLNIRGNVTGLGTVDGVGTVRLSGTGQQDITGNFTVSNLDIANTSTQGIIIGSGGTLRVEPSAASGTGLVTVSLNGRLVNNGKFILGSNALATAKIGPMPATSFMTSDVTQERYLPWGTGLGGWYLFGSPITGKNFTEFSDDFYVTGPSTGYGTQGGGILASSEPERSNIFKYNEATHNVRLDTVQKYGWTIPGNESMVPGKGYRAFVNYYSNTSHRVDFTGPFVQGDFTFPLLTRNELGACVPASFPCSETSWRGFNLMANPYPCDINWDASSTNWTKPAQLSGAMWRWNSVGSGYGVYASGLYSGATPAPANPNLIPSNQGFFVQLGIGGTYNANMSIKEGAKVTTTSGGFLRTNTNLERVRVGLSRSANPTDYGYDAVITFKSESTDGYDFTSDFASMGGNSFYLSIPLEFGQMSIASFPPISEYKVIPLRTAYQGEIGNFVLKFSEMESLLENNVLFIRDNLLGVVEQISSGSVYAYEVNSSDGLLDNRFELVFNPQSITGLNAALNTSSNMSVYPNPGSQGKKTNISLKGFKANSATVTIIDAVGKTVLTKSVSLTTSGDADLTVDTELAAGIYTVKSVGGKVNLNQKLVIK
jgi:hypothetical protein